MKVGGVQALGCSFIRNTAKGYGGVITGSSIEGEERVHRFDHMMDDTPSDDGSTFDTNQISGDGGGGAIYANQASVFKVSNTVFTHNFASIGAGEVFSDVRTTNDASAIAVNASMPLQMINVTFDGNTCSVNNSRCFILDVRSTSVTLTNSTFKNNNAQGEIDFSFRTVIHHRGNHP